MPLRPFQYRLATIFRLTALAGVGCAAWRSRSLMHDWIQVHGDRLAHLGVELAILFVFLVFVFCLMEFFPHK
ncbi:MAG TPA: hypothetical protein VND64_17030 [Pirellulales bacterium]|nr:hypothetical protein [Pirellulales bacterium]